MLVYFQIGLTCVCWFGGDDFHHFGLRSTSIWVSINLCAWIEPFTVKICLCFRLWWPFFVVLFHVLAPIPTLMARRYSDHSGSSNSCLETAIFLTMGILVCSFALPIVLARGGVILWGACWLTLAGNFIVYGTLFSFFLAFEADDSDYNMW